MGRPVKYHTPEARQEAMRASWRKYNENHREQRCEANREYVSRPYVKSHIADIKKTRKARPAEPVVAPGAFIPVRSRSSLKKTQSEPADVISTTTTGFFFVGGTRSLNI